MGFTCLGWGSFLALGFKLCKPHALKYTPENGQFKGCKNPTCGQCKDNQTEICPQCGISEALEDAGIGSWTKKEILVRMIKEQYKLGMRVRLLRMNDTQAPPVGTEGTVRGVDDIGSVIRSNLQERWRQYSIEKFLSSLCGYKLASLKNMHPFHDSAKRTQGELGDLEELLPERDSYNGDTQNQTKQKIDQGQL